MVIEGAGSTLTRTIGVDGMYYAWFAPPGLPVTFNVTASAPGYLTTTAQALIEQGESTKQSFVLIFAAPTRVYVPLLLRGP